MCFSTPVAFFIFNRPDKTRAVFESIRKIQPKKLLVVADGPRFSEEIIKCDQARSVIEQVDCKCDVLTNLSDKNLGCKYRVSSGLDWVFSEVEEAIILEDDCVPALSFFDFCQDMLKYYRYDERVMHIAGNNFQSGKSRTDYSYYFSKYTHIWGWASWRRAWKFYDVDMHTWPECKKLKLICSVFDSRDEQQYWTEIFDSVYEGRIDTWDYQWYYTCWFQNGISIIPNVNLVSNIGFGPDATHTLLEYPWSSLPTSDLWEIRHPPFLVRHQEADICTYDYLFEGKQRRTLLSKINRLFRKVKKFVKFHLIQLGIYKKLV